MCGSRGWVKCEEVTQVRGKAEFGAFRLPRTIGSNRGRRRCLVHPSLRLPPADNDDGDGVAFFFLVGGC